MQKCRRFEIVCAILLLGCAACLAAAAGDDLREAAAGVRQIVGHRGACAVAPENTLAGFRVAIEAGATAVELDIRTTKDGQLVLSHDEQLARTTEGAGRIGEKTLAEIKQLKVRSEFPGAFEDQRVPTLAEALAVCRGKIDVLLDLKEQGTAYAELVAAEIRRAGEPKRTIVGVRSVEQAKLFRRLLPESPQLGLIPNPESIEAFAQAGVGMIRLWPRWLGDATLVKRVRASGAKLHLNNTTGKPEEVVPLLAHRPDSLSSDDPARLVATLKELRSR
jgi:glycerophosphoryl diester phosphodiesterase